MGNTATVWLVKERQELEQTDFWGIFLLKVLIYFDWIVVIFVHV